MRLRDVPTRELRRVLRLTVRDAGPESPEVRILRAELLRRAAATRASRRRLRPGGVG